MVDVVTLGGAAAATKLTELGVKKSLKVFGKIVAIDFAGNASACAVGALGEAFDWSVPITIMLSLAIGITVNVSGTDILFKNTDGVVIGRKTLDEEQLKILGESIEGGSKTSGVGNPVEIAGKGSTGRTVPNNINEQMAMHQVQSNPLDNATELPFKLKDERWSASDGWVKMQSIVENSDGTKSTIHFVYNKITGAFDDFKFK